MNDQVLAEALLAERRQNRAMMNTIEALKERVLHLELEIIDQIAARIASERHHQEDHHGAATSELPDGNNDEQPVDVWGDNPDLSGPGIFASGVESGRDGADVGPGGDQRGA